MIFLGTLLIIFAIVTAVLITVARYYQVRIATEAQLDREKQP